jgi:hypothetical protein
MKRLISLIFSICAAVLVFAANDDIPEKVIKSFNKKFATAKKAVWVVKNGAYHVRFKMSKQEMRAAYGELGNNIYSGAKLKPDMMPSGVKKSVLKDFDPDEYKVKEVWKITDAARKTFYEIIIQSDFEKLKLTYSREGALTQKEEMLEEENNEEEVITTPKKEKSSERVKKKKNKAVEEEETEEESEE